MFTFDEPTHDAHLPRHCEPCAARRGNLSSSTVLTQLTIVTSMAGLTIVTKIAILTGLTKLANASNTLTFDRRRLQFCV